VIFAGEVGPGDAPALLFHGTEDPLVPYQWAKDTVDAAHADNLRAYLITWEGAGHVPYLAHRDEIIHLSTNFVYRTLDAGNAAR
jgi:pimeloyl-ACP methyl ester carboxylesterase